MKKKRIKLTELQVKSFVTTLDNSKHIRGGDEDSINCHQTMDCETETCDGATEARECETVGPLCHTNPFDRVTMTG